MTSPNQTELAKCPFCGGEAQTDFIEGESYLIECCVCRAETGIKDSEAEAIAAWNRRSPAAPVADPLTDAEIHEAWFATVEGRALRQIEPHHVAQFARAIEARIQSQRESAS